MSHPGRRLVLDSGGLSRLAERSRSGAALLEELRRADLWPAVVPAVVLVESLTGEPGRDVNTNRVLTGCEVIAGPDVLIARRAAALRHRAGRGSAVDAVVAATAEPGGVVLTSDPGDLRALAAESVDVRVESV